MFFCQGQLTITQLLGDKFTSFKKYYWHWILQHSHFFILNNRGLQKSHWGNVAKHGFAGAGGGRPLLWKMRKVSIWLIYSFGMYSIAFVFSPCMWDFNRNLLWCWKTETFWRNHSLLKCRNWASAHKWINVSLTTIVQVISYQNISQNCEEVSTKPQSTLTESSGLLIKVTATGDSDVS